MATELKSIFERVELVLGQFYQDRQCECCAEPVIPIAGSEDSDGVFQKYLCVNRKCPLFLTCTTE